MEFSLSPEHKLFIKTVREFCERRVDPAWERMDKEARMDISLIRELARLGVYGGVVSEGYGGAGMSFLEAVLAVEEISAHDPTLALSAAVGLSNSWPFVVELYGSEEAKQELLPRIAAGEALLGIASTEPQGGTDVAGLRAVTARRLDGSGWLLQGEKSIVSGGEIIREMRWGGGWFTIARTAPVETRHKGLTDFIVLMKRGGELVDESKLRYSRYEHIGRHAFDTGSLVISGLEVPDKYRVGEVNKGFYVAMEGFNLGRMIICGSLLGGVRWLLKRGIEWIKERKLFDKPLSSYQAVSFELAEIYGELEAVRLLTYKGAWMADRIYRERDPTVKPMDLGIVAAAAKTKATKLMLRTAQAVMEWHGGMAYFTDLPLFRALMGAYAYAQGSEGAPKALTDLVARSIIDGKVALE